MRALAGALCLLIAALAAAQPAHAHGGAFGPPPRPQAKGPPGGGVGDPPSHVDPGFGGPIVTPGPGGGVGPNPSKRKRPTTTSFETSWQLWWDLNRLYFLPKRRATATPTTGGDSLRPSKETWEASRVRIARERVEPYLLDLLESGHVKDDDTIASSLLAVSKIATTARAINVLLRYAEDDKAADIVRESAALGLGLLRRSNPAQQFKPVQYDIIRGRLLKIHDQYVTGKKLLVPYRTRAFAMLAIGLLGDQPFQQDAVSKDGRLICKIIWQRLGVAYKDRQLHIASLAALSLQPRAGIPDGVVKGLRSIVLGSKVQGRSWDAFKRAHAVTALARLGGPSANALLLRVLNDRKKNVVIRLAAALSFAHRALELEGPERTAAIRTLKKTFVLEQEMLGVGLANIALGRMVGADLAAGSTRVLEFDKADTLLLERAEKAPWYMRGFAALGLALAAREGDAKNPIVRRFRLRAQTVLLKMARDEKAEPSVRGAGVVGLGLLGQAGVVPAVRAIVPQSDVDAEVRAHAAVALGQIQRSSPEAIAVLETAAAERGRDALRAGAALGLSLLGSRSVTPRLLDQLDAQGSTRRLAGTTLALGYLGDFSAVEPLIATVDDESARDLVRAMAAVALGRLLDPEPLPSLLRLTGGVCYPARTRAFHEVFTLR